MGLCAQIVLRTYTTPDESLPRVSSIYSLRNGNVYILCTIGFISSVVVVVAAAVAVVIRHRHFHQLQHTAPTLALHEDSK